MDIVERLWACHGIPSGDPDCCCQEAAAEIERLRVTKAVLLRDAYAEIGRLRNALAAERERCARVCDEIAAFNAERGQVYGGAVAQDCAAAIRKGE